MIVGKPPAFCAVVVTFSFILGKKSLHSHCGPRTLYASGCALYFQFLLQDTSLCGPLEGTFLTSLGMGVATYQMSIMWSYD